MAKLTVDSAFVEEVLIGNNGAWGLKTSEPHSRKNDQDRWETVGRTFRTLKVSRNSGISLERFNKGDRITFEGREVTESKKSADGAKTYYDLVVWADAVELAGSARTAPAAEPVDAWATEDPNLPF
ncbi:hypothetical protein [Microbacterium sp. ProA8]|uniref:hypothetical protein n=1 Tax=Microbacterium chionoecetis TaxID=3153754 RepID=UPI003262E5E5